MGLGEVDLLNQGPGFGGGVVISVVLGVLAKMIRDRAETGIAARAADKAHGLAAEAQHYNQAMALADHYRGERDDCEQRYAEISRLHTNAVLELEQLKSEQERHGIKIADIEARLVVVERPASADPYPQVQGQAHTHTPTDPPPGEL